MSVTEEELLLRCDSLGEMRQVLSRRAMLREPLRLPVIGGTGAYPAYPYWGKIEESPKEGDGFLGHMVELNHSVSIVKAAKEFNDQMLNLKAAMLDSAKDLAQAYGIPERILKGGG